MSITRLDNLLKSGPDNRLGEVIQRAQQIDVLTGTLKAVLPAATAENLLSANASDSGELVLVCSTSAWAARLRFESNTLLAAARKTGLTVNTCKVKVAHTIQP